MMNGIARECVILSPLGSLKGNTGWTRFADQLRSREPDTGPDQFPRQSTRNRADSRTDPFFALNFSMPT